MCNFCKERYCCTFLNWKYLSGSKSDIITYPLDGLSTVLDVCSLDIGIIEMINNIGKHGWS